MKILKFGGTSVGSAERMKKLIPLVNNDEPKIVVLSAMSGTTNSLVQIANALYEHKIENAVELINSLKSHYISVVNGLYQSENSLRIGLDLIDYHFNYLLSISRNEFTAKEEKIVLAQGELLSTSLFQYYLEESGIDSELLLAFNFMRIDRNEEPDLQFIEENIKREILNHPGKKLFITQGYVCLNSIGEIDNLKRGGSDYTASLLGAAIHADEIQIWTDIDGMHNNDPRIVDNTFPVAQLSFEEAAELAYFGAKILHPTCVLPAQSRKIPVRLLNTMQPEAPGTLITENSSNKEITAIAAKDDIIAIKIKSGRMLLAHGFLRAVFEVFERYKTPIDMITTSEVAVSLTIDNPKHLEEIITELNEFCSVEIDHKMSIVCIVGNFTSQQKGVASKIFDSLRNIPIRMISYGGSQNNISILVSTEVKKEALRALNKGLFSGNKPLVEELKNNFWLTGILE